MYKAVLVDDEQFDLIGLQQLIPWEELGIEIVFSANKPLAALGYVQDNEVDILISDIRMPVMSGLELTRLCLQRQPELKTIFISGYQDFEYAKGALQLKADGYILKPVDDDEVTDLLRKVVAELDNRTRKTAGPDLVDFDFVRQDFLRHLLEDTIDDATIHTFLSQYPIKLPQGTVHAAVIEIDNARSMQGGARQADALDRALGRIEAFAAEHELGLECRLAQNRIALIYAGGDTERLDARMEELLGEIRSNEVYTATAAYGTSAASLSELHESFREAKELIGCKMFLGKDRLIKPGALEQVIVKDTKDVNAILDQLFVAISSYGLVEICDRIDDLFDTVNRYSEPVKVRLFSMQILSRLEGYLNGNGESLQSTLSGYSEWGGDNLAYLETIETIEDMKSWLRRTAFEVSESLYRRKQLKEWRLFPEIQAYVLSRMSEMITLKETATHFAYSPNHFGYLFKEQVGMSFNDYIVKEKLERAKELLQSPRMKIYEIAEAVGYSSLPYFNRTFKEMFGMTPGDYRKQG